jgi:hypothetical protein
VTAIPDVDGNVILLATRKSIGRTGRVGGLHRIPLDGRQNKKSNFRVDSDAGMAVSPGTGGVFVTATHIWLTSSRPEGDSNLRITPETRLRNERLSTTIQVYGTESKVQLIIHTGPEDTFMGPAKTLAQSQIKANIRQRDGVELALVLLATVLAANYEVSRADPRRKTIPKSLIHYINETPTLWKFDANGPFGPCTQG